MNLIRWLSIFAVVVTGMLGAGPARADFCGAEGERACTLTERIPSCDLNLVEGGGRCSRAICGAEGSRACGPTERFLFDFLLQMPVPKVCDSNLVNDLGKGSLCVHPPCGRDGERACGVLERIPSCDVNLYESGGKCRRPADCGRDGQPPCGALVRGPFFKCDVNLVMKPGGCGRAGTADTQTAAPAPAPAPTPSPATPPTVKTAGAMEANTDRPGADILGFELAQADPALCQAHCSANAQCVAWTFVRPGVAGPNARCFAKGTAAPPVANACCTSGIKAGSVAMVKPAATAPNPSPPPPPKSLLAPLR